MPNMRFQKWSSLLNQCKSELRGFSWYNNQNRKMYTNRTQSIPIGHELHTCTKWQWNVYTKWYQNWNFWYANIPSVNPAVNLVWCWSYRDYVYPYIYLVVGKYQLINCFITRFFNRKFFVSSQPKSHRCQQCQKSFEAFSRFFCSKSSLLLYVSGYFSIDPVVRTRFARFFLVQHTRTGKI
jgi:glycosyltransferase involved in cell wall biosynthesis